VECSPISRKLSNGGRCRHRAGSEGEHVAGGVYGNPDRRERIGHSQGTNNDCEGLPFATAADSPTGTATGRTVAATAATTVRNATSTADGARLDSCRGG
jgi:hypothetical protein